MDDRLGPVVLAIFDGWGQRPEAAGNAIVQADTPNYDQLAEAYPHLSLAASGEAVGLSPGTVGSAAAGFATLAAGRPTEQAERRISRAVADGTLGDNPVLAAMVADLLAGDGRLHLLGLVSNGQVVSCEQHYFAVLRWLASAGVPGERVFIHAVLDGHDTPPRSGLNYLARFAAEMLRTGCGRVATLMGRNYAMPGEPAWEALERAYGALVGGTGRLAPTAIQAIQSGYSRGEDDADISPAVVLGSDGLPLGRISPGDTVLCFNHQPRAAARLLSALLDPRFGQFARAEMPRPATVGLAATPELRSLGCRAAFESDEAPASLTRELIAAGRRVAVICEQATADSLEPLLSHPAVDATRLPSPPLRAIVDQPGRLCVELTDEVTRRLEAQSADLIIVDYINADLAGHRGQPETARAAVKALDGILPPLIRAARKAGATVLLTGCYGNVEELVVANSALPSPAHTANPVPLLLIDDRFKEHRLRPTGPVGLADLAPTVLALLGVDPPDAMTGADLLALLEPLAADDQPGDPSGLTIEISAVEALVMAIQVEEQALSYYQSAAVAAVDPDSAALYRHLAAGEEQRLRALERRRDLLAPDHPPPPAAWHEPTPRPAPDLRPLEVLELAVREELDTYRILCELAARNADPQGTVVMEQLANDELAFLDRLQRLSESEAIRLLAALPSADGRRRGGS